MAYREAGIVGAGLELVTTVVVGVVSGLTVVVLPPAIRELVVVASEFANAFYAGVLLGTLLGVFIASFTAFLTYRVWRLRRTSFGPQADNITVDAAGNYAPTDDPNSGYRQVTDGEPPWFDMYLVGVVSALVTMVFTAIVWVPIGAGVFGALASARLFGSL
jgi:hypothetical protein